MGREKKRKSEEAAAADPDATSTVAAADAREATTFCLARLDKLPREHPRSGYIFDT